MGHVSQHFAGKYLVTMTRENGSPLALEEGLSLVSFFKDHVSVPFFRSIKAREQEEGFHQGVQEVDRRSGQEVDRGQLQEDDPLLQVHPRHRAFAGKTNDLLTLY
uniref:(northern house mosquito) hypothetical protein n=1 Tax=Culex pipiens TaxID=7175 RepID=A0A8D8AC01_CULPI